MQAELTFPVSSVSPSSFVIDDFEDNVLHDKQWLESQPSGTIATYVKPSGSPITQLSLAVGEGRDGSNAMLVQTTAAAKWLTSFWVLRHGTTGSSVVNIYDDQGYLLPRGLRANRLEFWFRFEPGFREGYAATPFKKYQRNLHIGTYHFDPSESGKRDETHGWHFYHELWIRYDLAEDEWIHVVINECPQFQRNGGIRPVLNPTVWAGNYWELLTRFYIHMIPYDTIPEIGYPAKMWVDEIKLGYVPETHNLDVQIEDYENGQQITVAPGATRDFTATITNNDAQSFSGHIVRRARFEMSQDLIDPATGQEISGNLTLASGESKQVIMRTTPDTNREGKTHDVGIVVVPDDQLRPNNGSNNDPNVELRKYGEQGSTDAHIYGAFVRVKVG